MHNIGSFIRKRRKEKGISIRQLAKYTGVSPAYISQIENNYRNNPTPHVLRALSDGLGIDYDKFLLQIEQLTKTEVKERQDFYREYIADNESNTESTYGRQDTIDLYDILQENMTLYYKGKTLNHRDKDKILTMLRILLE